MSNKPPKELKENTVLVDLVNKAVQEIPENQISKVSDGYHTFRELYEHRMTLFQALVNEMASTNSRSQYEIPDYRNVWKSRQHSDGTMFGNMFIA